MLDNSMLPTTLNTNEVMDHSGVEQEFQTLAVDQRSKEFSLITESPALPHRILVKHQETGAGAKRVRRSLIRVDKTIISPVDNVTPITVSAYTVLVIPSGLMSVITPATDVLSELGSFVHTSASSTFKYDGTGNGAAALLSGGL